MEGSRVQSDAAALISLANRRKRTSVKGDVCTDWGGIGSNLTGCPAPLSVVPDETQPEMTRQERKVHP